MRKEALVSEQVVRIDAAELDRVRVVCVKCQGVSEQPLDKMHVAIGKQGFCHFCSSPLVDLRTAGTGSDPLLRLSEALRTVAQLQDVLRVEFVVKPPPAG